MDTQLLVTRSSNSNSGDDTYVHTCPGGQYEDSDGTSSSGCQPCALPGWAVWAVLLCSGLMVCGVVCWIGNITLRRLASTDANATGAGAGQLAAHGARGAVNIRHAMVTVSSTSTSFQYLLLFQLHLTWPADVKHAWRWLTSLVGLAWLRLEFMFTAFESLCAQQYIPESAVFVTPFVAFSVIFALTNIYARHKSNQVSMYKKLPSHLINVY